MEPEQQVSRGRVRMRERATEEPHRASSPLELLFDLTFVVAVAAITTQLAHGIAEGHGLEELPAFLQVFFAIWWAWMNFLLPVFALLVVLELAVPSWAERVRPTSWHPHHIADRLAAVGAGLEVAVEQAATPSRRRRSGSATRSPSRWRCSSSCCGRSTPRSCRRRSSGRR